VKTYPEEIDEGRDYIGFWEAVDVVEANVRPLETEKLPLRQGVNRIAAVPLAARISHPSTDVSLKDGFAVISGDVAAAGRMSPVCLKVAGSVFAGQRYEGRVTNGAAVKVCSGSPIPRGADAVVSGEFCEEVSAGKVLISADAGTGRNIMRAGSEVETGAVIARSGERLLPGRLGLAAAAGISRVEVFRKPRAAILSIGDEVVAPGGRLNAGQLYASNLVTMEAWLASFGIPSISSVIADEEELIAGELKKYLAEADCILTTGGAWGSERDLVVGTLDGLGWRRLFHYVRMGPGKGVAFGLWEGIPVFCLPGGPSSNETAFLQLALPALLRLEGDSHHPLKTVPARLTEDMKGRHPAWTEFKDVVVTHDGDGNYEAAPFKARGRLKAIAESDGFICIPEGTHSLHSGDIIPVQLLKPYL
jgi:molybdopterin molybdotransferase